jgi:hypothetical protein
VFNYPVGTFRYKAFISYSHKDRNWRAGKKEEAKSLMSKAIGQLEELFETVSDRDPLLEQLMTARFLYWQQTGYRPARLRQILRYRHPAREQRPELSCTG